MDEHCRHTLVNVSISAKSVGMNKAWKIISVMYNFIFNIKVRFIALQVCPDGSFE